jgi:hypothetical protein
MLLLRHTMSTIAVAACLIGNGLCLFARDETW